jgi:hypothetical protein
MPGRKPETLTTEQNKVVQEIGDTEWKEWLLENDADFQKATNSALTSWKDSKADFLIQHHPLFIEFKDREHKELRTVSLLTDSDSGHVLTAI